VSIEPVVEPVDDASKRHIADLRLDHALGGLDLHERRVFNRPQALDSQPAPPAKAASGPRWHGSSTWVNE
jgi:hypothetical protein